MTYRIWTIAIVATTVAASLLASPSAEAARIPIDEGGDVAACVTYPEMKALQDAWAHRKVTRGQVRRIFDTDGRRTSVDELDNLMGDAPVAAGYELVVPQHRMVRHYRGCIGSGETRSADVYVEFNTRSDAMVAAVWV